MTHKVTPVYWDTCVFIDGHQKTAGRIDDILVIERKARNGDIRLYTSALAEAEVVKVPETGLLTVEQERQIRRYFENKSFLSVIGLDRPLARAAADLVRTHTGLKPPDAVHIATAIKVGAACLCTYDGDNAHGGPLSGMLALDKKCEGLRILKPGDYLLDGTIFAKTT